MTTLSEHTHDEGTPLHVFSWESPDPIAKIVVCSVCGVELPYIEPPVFQYNRIQEIANIRPLDLDEHKNPCKTECWFGECSAPRTYGGCGGCCGCLGGCQVEYENARLAPFLWEGDYA